MTADGRLGRWRSTASIGTSASVGWPRRRCVASPAEERYAQTNRPDAPNPCSFATAAEAMTALDQSGVASDEALRDIEDSDLEQPAELDTDGALPSTLGSVVGLMAWHLNDHAEQIAKA